MQIKKIAQKTFNKSAVVLSTAAALSVVSVGAFAIDGTEADSTLADIAIAGAMFLAVSIAVAGWSYIKRAAR